MAGVVGSAARGEPAAAEGGRGSPGAMAAPAPEPAPAVPTFVNGLAQNVFSAATRRLDQRRGLGRVGLRHRRRRQARPPARGLHAAQGDLDRRPEGPGHLRGQPVLRAAPPPTTATGSSTTSSAPRRRRARSRRSSPARNTSPTISQRSTSRRGCRAASPSCTPSRPAPATPTAARPPAAATRRSARPTSSTGSTAAARPTRPAPATSRRPPVNWHNGHTAMMGTSYNGTIPIAAATTGVQGLDAIVPISAISDWYDYYRANGMVRAPHSASGGTGNNSLPRRGPRRARRRRLLPPRRVNPPGRVICRPLIDADRRRRGPPDRQPQRGLGRAQLHEGRQERPRRGADRPRRQRLQRHDQERGAVLRGAQGPERRRTSSTSTRAATAAPRRTR